MSGTLTPTTPAHVFRMQPREIPYDQGTPVVAYEDGLRFTRVVDTGRASRG